MKLLIIEDELSLLKSITDYFSKEDFLCETACSFEEGLSKIDGFDYDCVILDIGLPGGSGLKILHFLREEKKEDGVVIISAKNSVDDKINGLDLGADDYLTKPFHLAELSARVKALIRRKYSNGTNQIEYGGIRVDLISKMVTYQQHPLPLTRLEYDLFLFLLINKNRVISKQAIAEHLAGEEVDRLDSLDFVYSHIKNLKRKLKDRGCEDCIRAVYGFGYKFQL
ncbi:MAG: response regulator transcription factor [Chitinophagaceae bacterium]